ncbi:MAG: TonB-dependent receptor, partial [Bacteroidota bacterium]
MCIRIDRPLHWWWLPVLLCASHLTAQPVSGTVSEAAGGLPLVGANVYWMGTTQGTATDSAGTFTLTRHSSSDRLVVSFIGFVSDTIGMEARSTIAVSLAKNTALQEVEIARKQAATEVAYLNPIKVEKISAKELQKAACCNLSESFETSPTVDVSFTDAVTGTRQIQLLGLAGPYTQINRENMPDVRGLSVLSGLTYTPGTWIEGIQLNKGTGSVVNGFEGIAGQINVALQQPSDADRVFLNAYGNEAGRLEANAQFAHRFASEKWSTGLLLHGVRNRSRQDRNDDGFLDNPLSDRYVVLHRWNYVGDQGLRWQVGVKGVTTEHTGGQEDFE